MPDPSTLHSAHAEATCTLSLSPLSMPVAGGCILGAFLFLIPHGVFRLPGPPAPGEVARPIVLAVAGGLLAAFLGHAELRVTPASGRWILDLLTSESFLFTVSATPVLAVMCKVTQELHSAWDARGTTAGEAVPVVRE